MILIAKHLVLMTLALWIIPLLGRFLAQQAARKIRVKRPGITFLIALAQLAIAFLVPVIAQGLYGWLAIRWLSLAIAGAVYGALFGDKQDFPLLTSTAWGIVGGIAAWYSYQGFAAFPESQALAVAFFAVAPLLAYRPMAETVRRRLTSSGLITPTRRILR